jgi:serine/threonine-protein kinase RsbW
VDRLRISLPADSTRLPYLREELGELKGELGQEELEDLQLLVTELVTNSLRHASIQEQDLIEVDVEVESRLVRVDVSDPGPGFDQRFLPKSPERAGQWGLFIVDRVADRWGVKIDRGCHVWFVLGRHGVDR